MNYIKICQVDENSNGTYSWEDMVLTIPYQVPNKFCSLFMDGGYDSYWYTNTVYSIITEDGYTYAYPSTMSDRASVYTTYYSLNIPRNNYADRLTYLKYYEFDMKFTNLQTAINFSQYLVYNQTLSLRKNNDSLTLNNVEMPQKFKDGEWCHFKLVEKTLDDDWRSTCDLFIDGELFLEDVYIYQGHYNNCPNIVSFLNATNGNTITDMSLRSSLLVANLKVYLIDTDPRAPMIKINPDYGLNNVTLSYECLFDNASEVSHTWYDSNGNEIGNEATITVYDNGVYSLTVTDTNGNSTTGYFVNTATVFDIGCDSGLNSLSCSLTYYPDNWNFNKWKFEFDFTALVNEKKPMLYIVHNNEIRFEFGAVYCSDSENTVEFGNQYLNNKHHVEINVDTVNETLAVKIDDVIKGTFNTSFYPNEIRMSTENNGFNGISYNFKLGNLKIVTIDD